MSIKARGEVTSSRGGSESGFLGLLHRAALIAVLAGAAGSLGLMFRAGSRQNSRILLFLFAIWVPSPFVAVVRANAASKRWSILTPPTLSCLMLVLSPSSLSIS